MDERRIHDKLDKIEAIQVKQEINLSKLTVSVVEHVKRSNQFEDALKPVQKHVARVEGALNLLSILAVLAAIIGGVHEWFK